MNRLQKSSAALVAALWLSACSSVDDGGIRQDAHSKAEAEKSDTVSLLMAPQGQTNPFPAEKKEKDAMLQPRLGGEWPVQANPNPNPNTGLNLNPSLIPVPQKGADCEPSLPNDLVTREIYRLLSQGNNFENIIKGQQGAQKPDGGQDVPIQERIRTYRAERLKHYEDLFACRPGNEGIHQMARSLAANPNNRKAFTELFVGLVEQRGDEVLSHYTVEDFKGYSTLILDLGLQNLQARFRDLNQVVERDSLLKNIHKRVEEDHEELSLHALKAELVAVFQSQNGLPVNVKTDLQNSLEMIVAQELLSHIRSQLNNRMELKHTQYAF